MERATQPTVAATVLAIGLVLIVLLVHHTISDQRVVNTVGQKEHAMITERVTRPVTVPVMIYGQELTVIRVQTNIMMTAIIVPRDTTAHHAMRVLFTRVRQQRVEHMEAVKETETWVTLDLMQEHAYVQTLTTTDPCVSTIEIIGAILMENQIMMEHVLGNVMTVTQGPNVSTAMKVTVVETVQ